jgi:hypothetical protein
VARGGRDLPRVSTTLRRHVDRRVSSSRGSHVPKVPGASVGRTLEPRASYATRGIATNAQVHGATCPAKPDSVEPVAVGGEAGTLVSWNCGILINAAFTVHGGMGYRFVIRDPAINAATDPMDNATFTVVLASVVFR